MNQGQDESCLELICFCELVQELSWPHRVRAGTFFRAEQQIVGKTIAAFRICCKLLNGNNGKCRAAPPHRSDVAGFWMCMCNVLREAD